MADRLPPRTALIGGLVTWFATLGGAILWAVHSIAVWGLNELTCAAGREQLAGFPLAGAIGLATAIPGLGTAAALAASWLVWRRTRPDLPAGGERPISRAHLLAFVGLWLNLLALAIIVLDGVAALVFPPCQR
jgi:hypothetical protein